MSRAALSSCYCVRCFKKDEMLQRATWAALAISAGVGVGSCSLMKGGGNLIVFRNVVLGRDQRGGRTLCFKTFFKYWKIPRCNLVRNIVQNLRGITEFLTICAKRTILRKFFLQSNCEDGGWADAHLRPLKVWAHAFFHAPLHVWLGLLHPRCVLRLCLPKRQLSRVLVVTEFL